MLVDVLDLVLYLLLVFRSGIGKITKEILHLSHIVAFHRNVVSTSFIVEFAGIVEIQRNSSDESSDGQRHHNGYVFVLAFILFNLSVILMHRFFQILIIGVDIGLFFGIIAFGDGFRIIIVLINRLLLGDFIFIFLFHLLLHLCIYFIGIGIIPLLFRLFRHHNLFTFPHDFI